MNTKRLCGAIGVVGLLAFPGVGCATSEEEISTSSDALTSSQQAQCDNEARAAAAAFILPRRQAAEYQRVYSACVVRLGGGVDSGDNELPLVRRRTQIAAEIAQRHLARLPEAVKQQARCVSVLSKDTLGWGLSGGAIGAGLVSCVTPDGSWSAPSYLALNSVDLGPSIGLLDEDTTFVFTRRTMEQAFRDDFEFQAGVYATAGRAHAELSVDTDGCIVFDLLERREKHCTLAVSDQAGLYAGAKVSATLVRHMQGPFGGARVGRNARVYGRGVAVREILTTPGASLGIDVIRPWMDTLETL